MDLFDAPSDWTGRFDFVLESYTLQVLPPDLRIRAMRAVTNFLAECGTLLVICRARDEGAPVGQMPWPLTRRDLASFAECGLSLVELEEYTDDETPPVQRFRATYRRASKMAASSFAGRRVVPSTSMLE